MRKEENEKLSEALKEACVGGEKLVAENAELQKEHALLQEKYKRVMEKRASEQYGDVVKLVGLNGNSSALSGGNDQSLINTNGGDRTGKTNDMVEG